LPASGYGRTTDFRTSATICLQDEQLLQRMNGNSWHSSIQ
jgi:hypothetical protein